MRSHFLEKPQIKKKILKMDNWFISLDRIELRRWTTHSRFKFKVKEGFELIQIEPAQLKFNKFGADPVIIQSYRCKSGIANKVTWNCIFSPLEIRSL